MKQVVIGMDCGGTYTRCLVGDLQGNVLKMRTESGSNPFDIGMNASLKVIKDLYFSTVGEENFEVNHLCISSSGIDLLGKYNALRKTISMMLKIPMERLELFHDGVAALEGAFLGEDGILLISGTGSVVIGKKGNKIVKFGGWGHILGDEGSAYDMALEAIKIAIVSEEEKKKTALINKVKAHFKISNLRELLNIVYPCSPKFTIAGFSKDVIDCAKSRDEAALHVVNSTIKSLNRLLHMIISEIGVLPVALSGGLFSDEWFLQKFQMTNSYHFVKPALSSIIATYWMALGKPYDQTTVNKLRGKK